MLRKLHLDQAQIRPLLQPVIMRSLEDSTNGIDNPPQKVESTTHSMDLKTGRIVFKPKKKDSSLPAKDERVQMKSKHS